MASKGEDQLDTLLSRICKDPLEKQRIKRDVKDILTKVDIPSDWEEEDPKYKLHETNLTYKSRYCCLEAFIKHKEAESFLLTSKTSKEFFQELDSRFQENDPFLDQESSHYESPSFDLFQENVKIQGVVLQTSAKFKKASVLVKQKKQKSYAKGSDVQSMDELVLDVKEFDEDLASWSHIKVGDMVEVTKCRRKEGIALEPEVIRCFSRSEDEKVSFLEHLKHCIQTDGSTAAVIEIERFHAVWDYTVQHAEERCADQIICYILQITDEICSKAQRQMSHTLKGVLKSIEQSTFFTSALPNFVDKIIKEKNDSENCSLVRRFLEHMLNVCPSCGRRVLSMATLLAKHLITTSQDHESAKEGGQHAVDFLGKLASIIALHVPGALKHTEALNWRELPLIPVAQEIQHVKLKTGDLPVIEKDGKYESEEEYLNTYFRLLREECFHKLKKGITNFVNDQSKLDQRDVMLYRISLQGVSTHHENSPGSLSIALKYRMESEESIDYESSHWLKFGNLLCISFDATFQEPVWALVEKHIPNQSIVWVTLCKEKAGTMTEAQLITELQGMKDRDEGVYMAESQTFYVSFGPAMDVLQHKDCVPFKEFLVDACKSMEPASYIEKIDSPPDWGIIFEKDSLSGLVSYDKEQPYSLLKDFSALKFGKAVPKLDNTQLDAVELTLNHKLALIQGPPGTGKSFVGVNLVNLLISMDVPQKYGPILVVTYKNFALDHFLEDCLNKLPHGIKVVRTGKPADQSSEHLKKCTVYEVGRSQWTRQRFQQKRTLTGKLWAMRPVVLRAYMELKGTTIFDANMFLKEATEDQVRFLLRGAGEDFAEVERLLKKRSSAERRLKELVERALAKWLPSQQVLDKFAREEQKPAKQRNMSPAKSPETSSAGKETKGGQKDTEPEDPSDFREPSSEERERLLALDEEPSDEEERGGSELDSSSSQHSNLKRCQRRLLLLGNKGLKLSRDLLDMSKVWELDTEERIRLVYVLQREAHKRASEEFQRVTEEYVKIHQKLQELNNLHKIEVMRNCHVIGMTVTGAAIRANLLADIKPSVMIVEEAAEILEGQLVAVIPPSVQHLIMIGDHKQLKPMVHFDRLRRHHNLDLSMFERLVNCNLPYKQLGKQCRMIDKIAEVLRQLKIYDRLETNHQLVEQYRTPECVDKPMYFWTHTGHETKSKDSHSVKNSYEARKITAVAEQFCSQGGVDPSKITVLCSYRGQVDEIKINFKSSEVKAVQDIAVTTIDSFQGQENDIILISLVRSNKDGVIGYLKSMNRLCVAISRAHCGLYLFGNHDQLARASSKGWKVVKEAMRKDYCLGGQFPFVSREAACLPRSGTGSPPDRSCPSREQSTSGTCNININVSVGKDVTVTQHSRTDISQQDVMPADETIRLRPAPPGKTGKIPVQDPQTPVSKSPVDNESISPGPPPFEIEASDKEARNPTQETKYEEKTTEGSVKPDNCQFKQEPVQETENPKGFISGKTTAQQGSQAFSEGDFEECAKERPVQETEEPCAKKDKSENEKETGSEQKQESRDGQDCKEFAKEKPLQETVNSTKEEIGDGKQDGDTVTNAEQDLEKREVEESFKAHPIQETEGSSKTNRDETKTFPVQEEASIQSGMEKHADPQQGKCKQTSLRLGQGKPVQESESPRTKKGGDDEETKTIHTPSRKGT